MVSERKYTVLVKKRVAKLMQTLSEPYYSALKSAMYSLADNPRPYGYKKLRADTESEWATIGLCTRYSTILLLWK